MLDLKIDNYISRQILDQTDIFENIHPNYITGFGFILNFIILYYLCFHNNKIDDVILIGLLFSRWLADCLDGNVARKYNKTSKFGNIFDSVSDMILEIIIIFYFCKNINNTNFTTIIILICVFHSLHLLFYKNKVISQKKNIFGDLSTFLFINNSFLIYISLYIGIKNIENIKNYVNKII